MKLVIALGGNAIMPKGRMNLGSEEKQIRLAIRQILPLIEKHSVVITFGNGPQVGSIMIRSQLAKRSAYPITLSVAVAESEGELGYIIDQNILNALSKESRRKPVVSVLTQVLVDKNDAAFKKPTKPIGPFFKSRGKGHIAHEQGKGWRKVVPSPKPIQIIEAPAIEDLMKKSVVIAAGGGGIPVIKKKGMLSGIDAVIDKDLASACLARSVKADTLLILTDVPSAYANFGKDNQKPIGKINVKTARKLIDEGHFAQGSMLPKIEAGFEFAQFGGKAIITNIENAEKAMKEKAGTIIVK